ncbi:hypothetical protein L3X38_043701 [Prunus dulcis]|uniref:Uncharacterized protein n=1 Tax=Prunus dulcis TaxID=3755 RepID=A0AAD4UX85_PRUDU|nr:hypothetical protein L3X38_043701 [Prunus dulcis]
MLRPKPGKRSRLFIAEDICHVLRNNTGTETIRAIFFNRSKIGEPHLDCADFKKMSNLCLLNLGDSSFGNHCQLKVSLPNSLCYLSWQEYPLKSMPSNFFPENLVEFRMQGSRVEQLWNRDQNLENLKVMDLSFSTHLTKVPDLSQSRKLVHINLFGCISSYFQCLYKLTHLDLGECSNLKYLPLMPSNIEFLNLSRTAIKELPSSVWSHEKISYLDIRFCNDLRNLPSSSCKLKLPSSSFSLEGCSCLGKFSELPRYLTVLEMIREKIEVLPSSIEYKKFKYFPEILEPMGVPDISVLDRNKC